MFYWLWGFFRRHTDRVLIWGGMLLLIFGAAQALLFHYLVGDPMTAPPVATDMLPWSGISSIGSMLVALLMMTAWAFRISIKGWRSRHDPPAAVIPDGYSVILENDEIHTLEFVIEALQKACGYKWSTAFLLATEVHQNGRALVWRDKKESAELKCERLRNAGTDLHPATPVTPLRVHVEPLRFWGLIRMIFAGIVRRRPPSVSQAEYCALLIWTERLESRIAILEAQAKPDTVQIHEVSLNTIAPTPAVTAD